MEWIPDEDWSFHHQVVHLNGLVNLLILHQLVEEESFVSKHKVSK